MCETPLVLEPEVTLLRQFGDEKLKDKGFAAKVNPLSYQRPQAAPSSANVKQAEELFAKLGLAPALERLPPLL